MHVRIRGHVRWGVHDGSGKERDKISGYGGVAGLWGISGRAGVLRTGRRC